MNATYKEKPATQKRGRMYQVSFEIEAPMAMFTRPDSGAAQVSYPAPTYSAAKAMFESVARLRSCYIDPREVQVCRPIRYEKYITNYGGPLRKHGQITQGASYQMPALVLVDVCYRVYGVIREHSASPNGTNHLHALQEMFTRRLNAGQFFHMPWLGWKEFTPSYMGPIRPDTAERHAQRQINETIPSMLFKVFDSPIDGQVLPEFRQNVKIENGVLRYA